MRRTRSALALILCLWALAAGAASARRRAVGPVPPANDLVFIPDAGIRVDNATNPGVATDGTTIYLYYVDRITNREMVVRSTDGLNFSSPSADLNRLPHHHGILMPDGRTWRAYRWDLATRTLKSRSSLDGRNYVDDPGDRYAPQPADNGSVGMSEAFTDTSGGVVLLYIGDLMGLNNIRRAYSTDNGLTFKYERGNVLGDDNAGGGPNSYVDQKVIRLPDGRLRLFTMKQLTIYSFISNDDGRTFTKEDGARLERSAFTDISLQTLNDPVVLRLPDGRYRMYVAAAVSDGTSRPDPGPNAHWVFVSATTK